MEYNFSQRGIDIDLYSCFYNTNRKNLDEFFNINRVLAVCVFEADYDDEYTDWCWVTSTYTGKILLILGNHDHTGWDCAAGSDLYYYNTLEDLCEVLQQALDLDSEEKSEDEVAAYFKNKPEIIARLLVQLIKRQKVILWSEERGHYLGAIRLPRVYHLVGPMSEYYYENPEYPFDLVDIDSYSVLCQTAEYRYGTTENIILDGNEVVAQIHESALSRIDNKSILRMSEHRLTIEFVADGHSFSNNLQEDCSKYLKDLNAMFSIGSKNEISVDLNDQFIDYVKELVNFDRTTTNCVISGIYIGLSLVLSRNFLYKFVKMLEEK